MYLLNFMILYGKHNRLEMQSQWPGAAYHCNPGPSFSFISWNNINSSALDTEEGSKPPPGVLGIVEVSNKPTRRSSLAPAAAVLHVNYTYMCPEKQNGTEDKLPCFIYILRSIKKKLYGFPFCSLWKTFMLHLK